VIDHSESISRLELIQCQGGCDFNPEMEMRSRDGEAESGEEIESLRSNMARVESDNTQLKIDNARLLTVT
jgi:hypothetical protein